MAPAFPHATADDAPVTPRRLQFEDQDQDINQDPQQAQIRCAWLERLQLVRHVSQDLLQDAAAIYNERQLPVGTRLVVWRHHSLLTHNTTMFYLVKCQDNTFIADFIHTEGDIDNTRLPDGYIL